MTYLDDQDKELQRRAWTVCCDFHDDAPSILAHLLQWQAQYGVDEAGQKIEPPEGWSILPYRDVIPQVHREFYDGRWLHPRRCRSTMTPIFARPAGRCRAYAVPTTWLAGRDK